jgi:pimeloyl-ACP methyl ester carboxylesterase
MMEASERPITPESLPRSGKKTYEIEGTDISVSWKTFSPQAKEDLVIDPKKAVVFIPGWSIPQNAISLKPMGQEFANYSQSNTFIVDTVTEKVADGNLTQEAKALVEFIKDQGLNNITLVGNSQGGAEAIHLVALLQEQHPEIKIEGLALFDPVSLNQTSRRKLISNYFLDIVKTHLAIARPKHISHGSNVYAQNTKYDIDGIVGILKGVIHSKIAGFPAKVWNEISEMAKQNPDLQKVACPVILVQGSKDKVSNPTTTIPEDTYFYIDDLHTREFRLKDTPRKDRTLPEQTREDYLRETLFPNSPYVRVMVPEKMGYHNVTYSRPESVARTTLYLLKRFHRKTPNTSQ